MELLQLTMVRPFVWRTASRVICYRRRHVTFSPTPQTACWGRRTEPRKVPITCWKNSEIGGAFLPHLRYGVFRGDRFVGCNVMLARSIERRLGGKEALAPC